MVRVSFFRAAEVLWLGRSRRRLIGRVTWLLGALAATMVVACSEQSNFCWPSCPDPPVAGPYVVAPGRVSGISNQFGVSIRGQIHGSVIRSLEFRDGEGTVETANGLANGVLYDGSDFAGYRVFVAIVPTADRWHVLYAYCQGGALRYVWHFESASQKVTRLNATGVCQETEDPSVTTDVPLAGSSLQVPILCGLEIDGTGVDPSLPGQTGETISVAKNQVGTVVLRQPAGSFVQHEVIPFAGLNCNQCGEPGWYEVHALFRPSGTDTLAYGVLYLFNGAGSGFPDEGPRILLDLLLMLPGGQRMPVAIFEGKWMVASANALE